MGFRFICLLSFVIYTLADEILTANDTIPYSIEGWAKSGSEWSGVGCQWVGQTYVMSSTFARCCANSHSDCGFATSCTDGSTILKGDGGTSLCTSGQNCAFMTIYDYATTDTPYLDIFCWEDWPDSASQIFRTTAITTSSGTVLQTSTNPATPGASPTTHVPAATTSASAADKKLQKKSWITEAVIGAVAGCLVFGGLCFWLAWRWRGKRGHDGRAEAHKSTNSETWNGQIIHSQNLLLPRELPANPKIALIELYAPPPPPR